MRYFISGCMPSKPAGSRISLAAAFCKRTFGEDHFNIMLEDYKVRERMCTESAWISSAAARHCPSG